MKKHIMRDGPISKTYYIRKSNMPTLHKIGYHFFLNFGQKVTLAPANAVPRKKSLEYRVHGTRSECNILTLKKFKDNEVSLERLAQNSHLPNTQLPNEGQPVSVGSLVFF